MAIIKCPECGHQTSDKAPVCPNCGVEIAGKIIKCPYCGEIYLKSEVVCPHCHKSATGNENLSEENIEPQNIDAEDLTNNQHPAPLENDIILSPQKEVYNTQENDVKNTDNSSTNNFDIQPKKKNNKTIIIVSIIIAIFALGICFHVYKNAQTDKEEEEYEYAMSSEDPMILQEYLNNFKDAPQEHIDSINARLQRLSQLDQDWTNAVVSGSKSALTEYLKMHPDSPHKQEALDKIDSIDWEQCSKLNTSDAYQMYIDNHSDGNHYEEAVLALKKIKADKVSLEERQAIGNIFHKFFISINERDENGLISTVNDYVNFLGKSNATKEDIIVFMNKLYKQDVQSMMWSISSDYNIQKKEIGDEQYEYSVSFMTNQKVEKTDATSSVNKYKISAKVNPDGKITEMSMTRINE